MYQKELSHPFSVIVPATTSTQSYKVYQSLEVVHTAIVNYATQVIQTHQLYQNGVFAH